MATRTPRPAPLRRVKVRLARPEDQPALVTLWRGLERIHGQIAPRFFRGGERAESWCPPELGHDSLDALSGSPDLLLLVAEQERQLVGALSGSLRDTPRSASLTPCRRLYVDTLIVDPAQRRAGIGKQLMAQAERWAKKLGAEQALLTVWTGNTEAEEFYRALGYAQVSQVLARDL